MNILWVEDFGSGTVSILVLGMFCDIIPIDILFEEYDDDEDVSVQLPRLFSLHSNHQISVCKSYSEWKVTYEDPATRFDIAILDINLNSYKTPQDIRPVDNENFDSKAGLYIYHQLIKSGMLDDNIAFFTGEENTLRNFLRDSKEILIDSPLHSFEKKDDDFRQFRDWLSLKPKSISTGEGEGQMVFVAYAHEDRDGALVIYDLLKKNGYQPWIDIEDLLPGQDWNHEIEKAIFQCEFFIACLSDNSVSKKGHFQKELKKGLGGLESVPEGAIYLIPVRLDKCPVPERMKKLHWCDFNEESGPEKLLRALRAGHNH